MKEETGIIFGNNCKISIAHTQQGNDNNDNKMQSTMSRVQIQAKKRQEFKIKIIYNPLVRKVTSVLF
jgi:hypothetical protein